MKIALLAGANVIHSVRWANGLADCGHEIHLISAHAPKHQLNEGVCLHLLPVMAPWGYVVSVPALRRLLARLKPDILNAHYATGYGLLARLSKFSPLFLSVWGSDVYAFPRKSRLHRRLLKANLSAAAAIGSTSHCMARVVCAIDPRAKVYITPFGIDTDRFCPVAAKRNHGERTIVIGTVKTLSSIYGIDVLIRAFALVLEQTSDEIDLRLEIVGEGPQQAELQALAKELGVGDRVRFFGRVPHEEVPSMLSRFDIYAALSRSESFGVAALEASACGLPTVVSDAEGLAEVSLDCESALVVPKGDAMAAAQALATLTKDSAMRSQMGLAGRAHVLRNYSWSASLQRMLLAYEYTITMSSSHE